MEIQRLKFEGHNDVIISVGFFLASDLEILLNHNPLYVELYEPRKDICSAYEQLVGDDERFKIVQKAVSGKGGDAQLSLCTKISQSTILKARREMSVQDSHVVDVVSMSSVLENVLKRHKVIDQLLINCEGSEISIIDNTSPKLFARCGYMFIQFHDFISPLGISASDISRCSKKLTPFFDCRVLNKRYSKYEFKRKGRRRC